MRTPRQWRRVQLGPGLGGKPASWSIGPQPTALPAGRGWESARALYAVPMPGLSTRRCAPRMSSRFSVSVSRSASSALTLVRVRLGVRVMVRVKGEGRE